MLTKKQFCQMLINNYKQENNIANLEEKHCLKCSFLAVAMEYLGLIKAPELKIYAATRAGVVILDSISSDNEPNKRRSLTVRDILHLLPE